MGSSLVAAVSAGVGGVRPQGRARSAAERHAAAGRASKPCRKDRARRAKAERVQFVLRRRPAADGDQRPQKAFVLDPLLLQLSTPCAISTTAAACSTPRTSSRALAEAVGTPFYCYSTATLERHYRVFADAFAGEKSLVCYAMKANSNQSVLRTLARLGAGVDVVSGGELKRASRPAYRPTRSCFPASARPRRNCAPLVDRSALHQCRIRARTGTAVADRGGHGPHRADFVPGQSGRRCRHPRQDLDRQVGEQVRHPARPPARGLCARGETPRRPGHRRRHAYRQPDHRPRTNGSRVRSWWISCARCAATVTPSRMSISAAGWAFPIIWTSAAPPEPAAYAAMVKRARGLGCTLMFEPGRMIVGNAGILRRRA